MEWQTEDEIALRLLPALISSNAELEMLKVVRQAYDLAEVVLAVRMEREHKRQQADSDLNHDRPAPPNSYYSKPFGLK